MLFLCNYLLTKFTYFSIFSTKHFAFLSFPFPPPPQKYLRAPFGINNSQYMFLIKICHSPGILQDSLMDMFYVHPSNIVRTLAALEMQGMITRSPHDKDKRTCKLYPTERALSIIDEVQTVCKKALKGALLALTRQFFSQSPLFCYFRSVLES